MMMSSCLWYLPMTQTHIRILLLTIDNYEPTINQSATINQLSNDTWLLSSPMFHRQGIVRKSNINWHTIAGILPYHITTIDLLSTEAFVLAILFGCNLKQNFIAGILPVINCYWQPCATHYQSWSSTCSSTIKHHDTVLSIMNHYKLLTMIWTNY